MNENDITLWLGQLHQVDQPGAEAIWREYFPKLVRLANKKLGQLPRRTVDEEDVALSAMNSFFQGAKAGRFELGDRDDLWKLLVTITARKATKQWRRQLAEKRGGGQVLGESIFQKPGDDNAFGLAQVLDENRLPEMADQVVQSCGELLSILDDKKLAETALMRMEGYTNQEISDQLGCSISRTKQRLTRIKEKWSSEWAEQD